MAANSRTAVATHILATLALKNEPVPSSYLGGSVNTNPVVVRRILSELQKAGLVETTTGKNGGTVLSRAPEKISLQDIYLAVEKGTLFAMNRNHPNKKCPISCVMQSVLEPIFQKADDVIVGQLAKTKLSDVVKDIAIKAKL